MQENKSLISTRIELLYSMPVNDEFSELFVISGIRNPRKC